MEGEPDGRGGQPRNHAGEGRRGRPIVGRRRLSKSDSPSRSSPGGQATRHPLIRCYSLGPAGPPRIARTAVPVRVVRRPCGIRERCVQDRANRKRTVWEEPARNSENSGRARRARRRETAVVRLAVGNLGVNRTPRLRSSRSWWPRAVRSASRTGACERARRAAPQAEQQRTSCRRVRAVSRLLSPVASGRREKTASPGNRSRRRSSRAHPIETAAPPCRTGAGGSARRSPARRPGSVTSPSAGDPSA